MRRRTLVWAAAGFAVLFAASSAWAPPPAGGGRPAGRPGGSSTGSGSTGKRITGGTTAAAKAAKAEAKRAFESMRSRDPADAARYLREEAARTLSRTERAVLLNAVALQIVRQQRQQQISTAERLASLRQLRADWAAVGPGAGLDPLVELELAAAESAAERLALVRALDLAGGKQYAAAASELAPLADSRHLPVPIVRAIPGLRSDLLKLAKLVGMTADGDLPRSDAADGLPAGVKRAVAGVEALRAFAVHALNWSAEEAERALAAVEKVFDAEAAGKLRVELSAAYFLAGRQAEALKLLEGDIDAAHAREVLADLRTAVGGGQLVNAHVARSLPGDRPAAALAPLVPDALRTNWKVPATPADTATTISKLEKQARKRVAAAIAEEVAPLAAKADGAVAAIRAELAKHAGPLGAFEEKVKARLGRPVGDEEKALVTVAAVRGMAVGEAVAALAADADRPAQAGRLVGAAVGPARLAHLAAAAPPPVALGGDADGAFRLSPDVVGRDREKVRDAARAVLTRFAEAKGGTRSGFEAAVATECGLPPGEGHSAPAAVAALLDACRDLVADRTRSGLEWRELDDALEDVDERNYDDPKDRDAIRQAKARRDALLRDATARGQAIALGVRMLAEYGPDAAPALPWLRSAAGGSAPWKDDAAAAVARLTAKP